MHISFCSGRFKLSSEVYKFIINTMSNSDGRARWAIYDDAAHHYSQKRLVWKVLFISHVS